MPDVRITWEDLREVEIGSLKPGDSWLLLDVGVVCWADVDGRVRGHFVDQPRGTVATLDRWEGLTATATLGFGEKRTQTLTGAEKVMRITTRGPG